MALKSVAATLEELDESLRPLFQEIPDPADKTKTIFALDLDDTINNHPKIRAMKTALEATKTDLKDTRTKLGAATERLKIIPEDFDPEAYKILLEDKENKGKKIDERIAAVRAEEEKKTLALLAPKDARIAVLESSMKAKAANEAITEALTTANIAPEFMGAARALIATKYKIKTEEPEPGDFVVTIDTEAGDSDAKAFVRDWVQGDEGKHFVRKATGGGAEGGKPAGGGMNGENPFAKGAGWNMTKQQELIKANPMLARSKALEAGVRVTW